MNQKDFGVAVAQYAKENWKLAKFLGYVNGDFEKLSVNIKQLVYKHIGVKKPSITKEYVEDES